MSIIPGTVVTSGLSPGNALNTHETHRALYGKGGYRTTPTTTSRNQIPPLRREEGMLVYVISDGFIYKLKSGAPATGDTSDSNWEIFTAGGSATVITGTIASGGNFDLVVGQTADFTVAKYLFSLTSATKAYGEELFISKDHTDSVVPGFSKLEYSILGDIAYSCDLVIVGADLVFRVTNNELVTVTYTFKN
jgi:hypothetical protein